MIVLVAVILLPTSTSKLFAQSDKYDGIYIGLQTLSEAPPGGNWAKCLRGPFKRRLVIKSGTAVYTYNPTYQGQVIGTVSADGDVVASASTSSGGLSLAGKINGDDFTGEVWSLICTYSVQLRRSP